MTRSRGAGLALTAALAACGGGASGGDDDDIQPLPTSPPEEVSMVAGEGFISPMDAVPSLDGRTFYFSAFTAEESPRPGIFSVEAAGGDVAVLFAGSPLENPAGLLLSADGENLIIADIGARAGELDEDGRAASVMYTLSTGGGALAPMAADGIGEAAGLALGPDGETIYVTGYMLISPENPDNLVVVANYVPLLIPSSGPNFYKFSDNVAYDIHVDNDGDAKDDLVYRFLFATTVQNGNTFLYNTGAIASLDDPDLNVQQYYDVIRIDRKSGREDALAANVPVAPWYVGDRSFPPPSYEGVALSAIESGQRRKFFAGPRDEPFFVDLHVFDLLGVGGAPTTDGLNVMSIVMEVPIAQLAAGGRRPTTSSPARQQVVGIHATAARQRLRVLRRDNPERNLGGWIQVSRLAWPLVNEVLIPLKDKDKYNRSLPKDDVSNFGSYILFPELPGLLRAVLNAPCADTPSGGRTDIVGLLAAKGTKPADLQRIDVSAGQTFAQSAFPNGRALADDVFDIEATLLCNGGVTIADGVNANDKPFTQTFPYLASPASGNPISQ